MKVMRVEVRALTFPLISQEYQEYTTYQWVRIYPSFLQLHSLQPNNTQYTDLEGFRCHSPVHHCLEFSSSDEEIPVRPSGPCLWHSSTPDSSPVCRGAELPLPVQCHMNHHNMSPPSTDQFFKDDVTKENFPTAPLDDDIWLKDQTPDRHLCIHDTSQPNHLCHYPCPYANLNFTRNLLPSLTLEAAEFGYNIMDLMDADLEDIMSTTSAENNMDLEDISAYPDSSQLKAWFA